MSKTPFVTKDQLLAITEQYPTPFHLYDEKAIRQNVRDFQEAFSWNEGFKEYFAVKANPNPYILEMLKEEGCGMDCSSMAELVLSEAVGLSGSDIMFTSNQTPAEDFVKARELDATITLDDFTHIDFLEEVAGLPKMISCRFNPGVFDYKNHIMSECGDAKYGFTPDQMVEGFKILKEKGVEEFGIHAFLASNTDDEDYYPTLAKLLFQTAVRLKNEAGVKIKFINLSGGIGIPYELGKEKINIFNVGAKVHKVYDEVFGPEGMTDVAIVAELGRYILGPYGCLVTKAVHEKHIHKEYIGVDACASNLMRPMMYGAYHHITVMGKEDAEATHKYDVVGGLCENSDKFAIDRMLPEVEKGDLIVIHDAGAHGHSMGYNYNGKLRSAEVLYKEDGSTKLIRRAETLDDYFATLDFPGLK